MALTKKQNLKPLTKEIKDYLIKVGIETDAKRKFKWAANIYERYRKQYICDENFKYNLGLFYDHYVIFKVEKMKNEKRRETLKKIYLEKAENLYKEILTKNQNNFFAFHGLSRVYLTKKNYKKAIFYELKAYKLMQNLPKNQRGILSIGNIYLLKKDYKNAEKWFKKELNNLGENDLSANASLMTFYIETKNYKKALPYALKTEKLLKATFKNSFYEKYGAKFRTKNTNKTLKLYLDRIEKVKKFANKR